MIGEIHWRINSLQRWNWDKVILGLTHWKRNKCSWQTRLCKLRIKIPDSESQAKNKFCGHLLHALKLTHCSRRWLLSLLFSSDAASGRRTPLVIMMHFHILPSAKCCFRRTCVRPHSSDRGRLCGNLPRGRWLHVAVVTLLFVAARRVLEWRFLGQKVSARNHVTDSSGLLQFS